MSEASVLLDRFAEYYDDDYRDYEDDLGLILELADEARGRIVELGCGTGRVLLPLAQMGAQVTGVDASPALLEVARRKIALAGVEKNVELHLADLRETRRPAGAFSLAVCTSNTLMHLTTSDDQQAALTEANRLLKSGGLLMLDLFNPDLQRLFEIAGVQELADRWQTPDGGEVIKWSVRQIDPAEQLQETLFIYEEIAPNGAMRRTLCPFTLRYIWRNEGELMLRVAGFEVEEVWGDFDGSEYVDGCDHLVFMARKA